MYIEKQYFKNPFLLGLKWVSGTVLVLQLGLLLASESGAIRLPFSYAVHLSLLFGMVLCLILLDKIGVQLLITEGGIDVRYWVYQLHKRHINWTEIRRIKLLSLEEVPKDAFWRLPNRDGKQIYLLTNPHCQVLLIELWNGAQIFTSIKNHKALLDFLDNNSKFFTLIISR
jgi:hypothetical protein